MGHMALIMGYVVLRTCINILQYLSLPCAHGWRILHFGKWMECTQWTQKCHTLLFSLCLQWPRQTSYSMLFLIWHFNWHCRVENWVRNGPFPKRCEHLLFAHQIYQTCESNPRQWTSEGEETIRQTNKAFTVEPQHCHGNCVFYCAKQT